MLYPTDTLYGLGADALSDTAIAKIYTIKERDTGKPMHAIVADVAMAERYAEVDDRARTLAEKFLPGPLTLILEKKPSVATGIGRGMDTIGIRIPDDAFCRALARVFDAPITTTSANKSGLSTARRVDKILEQLGERAQKIDLIIDAGELSESKPSTIVDLTGPKPLILREGAISSSEILALL